jgi:hypothetical protein
MDGLTDDEVGLSESPVGCTEFYSDVRTAGKLRVENFIAM